MSARGEHEAEGRAVEAHQEAKHERRASSFHEDLTALLDYVQPDEEKDAANLEEGNENGIVEVIRRLRAAPVTLTEAEAADVVDALDDAAELALHTGRSTAASEAEELRDVVRRAIKRSEEEAT